MKKLQTSDLTPALLTEVMKLNDPKEVVAFFESKGFEVSEKAAQKILDHVKKAPTELSLDELSKVSGGCGDYSGTAS